MGKLSNHIDAVVIVLGYVAFVILSVLKIKRPNLLRSEPYSPPSSKGITKSDVVLIVLCGLGFLFVIAYTASMSLEDLRKTASVY